MESGRWSDAFLDEMRQKGDAPADEAVRSLFQAGQLNEVQNLMNTLVENDDPVPEDLPGPIRDYLHQTGQIDPRNLPRIRQGQKVFNRYGPEVVIILACYSLPAAYATRHGVKVLHQTGYLDGRPNRRLIETGQMIVDVMGPGGLGPNGRGVRSAQKVRLMHAAIRHLIQNNPKQPWDAAKDGVPINQEDLAGTLMTFSYLVLDGLERMEFKVKPRAQESYLAAWRAVGRIMGIVPELLPENVEQARELTERIQSRQIYPPGQEVGSKEGRDMAQALLDMLEDNVPLALRLLPASLMRYFLPPQVASGLAVPEHLLGKQLVEITDDVIGHIQEIRSDRERTRLIYRNFGLRMVQKLIDANRGGQRTQFVIPTKLRRRWDTAGEPGLRRRLLRRLLALFKIR